MATNQSDVFLFLDDIRDPQQAYTYTNQEMFLKKRWRVVRNYEDFKDFIIATGLPKFISFDHDLAPSHYTPSHYWDDYYASKKWQDAQVHTEKTGYDCAKFLVEYCTTMDLDLPDYYCHSMNPVGKDRIITLLESFARARKNGYL